MTGLFSENFRLINTPAKILHVMRIASEAYAQVTFWALNKNMEKKFLFRSLLAGIDARARAVEVTLPPKMELEEIFPEREEEEPPPEFYVSITIRGRAVIAFYAAAEPSKKNTLLLSWPTQIGVQQRRMDRRWEIPKAYELEVFYTPDPEKKLKQSRGRLFDLSEKGFSFSAPASEKPLHRENRLLRGCYFVLRSKKVSFDAVETGATVYRDGRLKVGARIQKMAPADRQYLELYLAEQFVQYSQPLEYFLENES